MTSKITVLGAGLVGKAIAIDLAQNYDVTSVDINDHVLQELNNLSIKTIKADLSQESEITSAITNCDLVIGAVPGFMGYKMVETVIKAGKNIVDISFFPEEIKPLDELAQKHKVIAVVDCGVAPGVGNIILGHHTKQMTVTKFDCMVGGLPLVRKYPYEYKAPFSPIDVIEEYTRPVRFVIDGKIVNRVALSEIEHVEFDEIGTLEAFNTDGLRSLLHTVSVPNMREKTLRYPGHADLMRILRDTGFFSDQAIDVSGNSIKPIDLTTKLLFPLWKSKQGEKEFTVLRIIIDGIKDGKTIQYTYEMLDRYNEETQTSSMARTTGYTCNAAANLILTGKFKRIGISPPEYIGFESRGLEEIMAYLEKRKISFSVKEKLL